MRRPFFATSVLFFLMWAASLGADSGDGIASRGAAGILRPGDVRTVETGVPPAGAEEWEAFLSVDGGRTFPIRITPHLPIAERSFSWTIPSLPTPEGRILFRFGIGGVEHELVSPERFAIDYSAGATSLSGSGTSIGNSPAPGEEGTLAWVERRGNRTFLVVAGRTLGMAPESRWSAATRAWRWIPRQRSGLVPAALAVSGSSLSLPPGFPIRIAPRERSIASVSRLNL